MEELTKIDNYKDLDRELGKELNRQAVGFVRTGYLLKVARDTEYIKEGGFNSVFDYAKQKYGLTKDVVSRYIAINDRYSVDGYSDRLQEKYQEYGIGKLQDMLTLPNEIVDMLSPKMTRAEIGEVKDEFKAEESVSPIEIIQETMSKGQEDMDIFQRAMHQYLYENPDKFVSMATVFGDACDTEMAVKTILDTLAPSGVAVISVRIPGAGRTMMSFRGESKPVEVMELRTREIMTLEWSELVGELRDAFGTRDMEPKRRWSEIYYGECFPQEDKKEEKKAEVAPVQQDKEKEADEPEKRPKETVPVTEEQENADAEQDSHPQNEKVEVAPVQQDKKEWQEPEMVETKQTDSDTYDPLPGQLTTQDIPELMSDASAAGSDENIIDGTCRDLETDTEECPYRICHMQEAAEWYEKEIERIDGLPREFGKQRQLEIGLWAIRQYLNMHNRQEG